MPERLEVAVLGPVRAWAAGRPVRLGTTRQRAVFASLVVAAGRIVTPAELVADVWGGAPPAAARDNLYTYVSGLRRSLTGGVLESHPTGYRLALAADARDSDRFVAMVDRVQAREEAGVGAVAVLEDALRLWRGEAYAGCEGERFEVERAHLGRLRFDAIERRARLQLELGDDDLIAELSGLVREYPLHEPYHELLMRALHRAGRSADAVSVFHAASDVLATELDAEPGARLREVHRRIVTGPAEVAEQFPAEMREPLRLAALLGPGVHAGPLVVASGRPPAEVLGRLEEAVHAGVLTDTGSGLTFTDPLVAEAIAQSITAPDRIILRRRLAQALTELGSPAAEVATQLTAEPPEVDDWLLSWSVAHLREVAEQAPRQAVRLGRALLDSALPSERQRAVLLVAYAQAGFRLGENPEREARQAIALAEEPATRAEMRQLLADARTQAGDPASSAALLREALADQTTPPTWRTRHRKLLAQHGQAGHPHDDIAVLQQQWRTSTARRDHGSALHHVDRALALLGPRTPYGEIQLDLLDNRILSLQNLDRLDEADRSLAEAARTGIRHRLTAPLALTAAVQDFWCGRWDEAVTRLSGLAENSPSVGLFGRREQRAGVLLRHGVLALIAVQRGHSFPAGEPGEEAFTGEEREHSDFLLVARARSAEKRGLRRDGLAILTRLLDPAGATLRSRHPWLPELVRVARLAGRVDLAERATSLCAAEAAQERTPAGAAMALARCQALMSGDPRPALVAAEHYRSVGRRPEQAAALAEAAVLARPQEQEEIL